MRRLAVLASVVVVFAGTFAYARGNPAAAALPRAFVLCTADKDLQADPQMDPYVLTVERVRSDPNWRVVELAENHMANLNNPQATAEALLSLV